MSRRFRRTSGAAIGALLALPTIALSNAPLASAGPGDLTYVGPIPIDGFTESLTYNTATQGLDNFIQGSSNFIPFDLDTFLGTPQSFDSGFLFTIPLLYQGGFVDLEGTFTPISTFTPADFLSADQGAVELGAAPDPAVESINLSSILGVNDVFSINTSTLAFDNLLAGSYDSVPFYLDISTGAADGGSYDAVFTIPSLLQLGVEDIGGAITPLFSLNPGVFVGIDVGLAGL